MCLVYVHCDCRKGADSSCYIRAGMYAWYLNKIMLVKKLPAGVNGSFIDMKSFLLHCGPGVDSASNRNEYQEYFLGVKAAGA